MIYSDSRIFFGENVKKISMKMLVHYIQSIAFETTILINICTNKYQSAGRNIQ